MKIYSDSNTEVLILKATDSLVNLLQKTQNQKVLFLTSGGSAFKLLENIPTNILNSNFTITVLDERFFKDPKINNFGQLMQTNFYKIAKDAGCQFIDTSVQENETQDYLAERFEQSLKKWKQENPEGAVIATLGVGPDGHTSGIMPFPEDQNLFINLFENEKWVVGYDAGDKNEFPLRVTTTITFLKDIVDHSIAFVSGVSKMGAFNKLMEKDDIYKTPAGVFWQMKDAELFTDLKS